MSRSNGDGDSNGHGPIGGNMGRKQIERLLTFHEQAASSLRFTLKLMDADLAARRTERAPSVIDDAIAIEAARVDKKRGRPRKTGGQPRTQKEDQSAGARTARREASAALLARFSTVDPIPAGDGAIRFIGPLVRRGYLKKKGEGYLRTAKEFTI